MGSGKVVLVQSVRDEKLFICKKNLKKETEKDALLEMQLLHKLNHPNILQTKEGFYDSKNDLTQIIEFCGYGSLQHQFDMRLNDPEAEIVVS